MDKIILSQEEIQKLEESLESARESCQDSATKWEINQLLGKIKNLESDFNPYQKILSQEIEA